MVVELGSGVWDGYVSLRMSQREYILGAYRETFSSLKSSHKNIKKPNKNISLRTTHTPQMEH